MSSLTIGQRVRVHLPRNDLGRLLCARHELVDVDGQVGEVASLHDGAGHTVGVVFPTIWRGGARWSEYLAPDELVPVV